MLRNWGQIDDLMKFLGGEPPFSHSQPYYKIHYESLWPVRVVSIWHAHFCEHRPLSSTNVPGYLHHSNIYIINNYHQKPITPAILEEDPSSTKDSTKVEAQKEVSEAQADLSSGSPLLLLCC